jgi:hypothetical protein
MKKIIFRLFLVVITSCSYAQVSQISVSKANDGMKLIVDGNDFMINGMNWDYIPIGSNYSYSLWEQPDNIIKAALDAEMGLLQNMGVNAIREYTGMQPKWVTYIYEKYGIYTMLNHSFGRYGLNTRWKLGRQIRSIADPAAQSLINVRSKLLKWLEEFKDTPGLLNVYLLGNENNYGLSWAWRSNRGLFQMKRTEKRSSR